jgi:hypothetical protein
MLASAEVDAWVKEVSVSDTGAVRWKVSSPRGPVPGHAFRAVAAAEDRCRALGRAVLGDDLADLRAVGRCTRAPSRVLAAAAA